MINRVNHGLFRANVNVNGNVWKNVEFTQCKLIAGGWSLFNRHTGKAFLCSAKDIKSPKCQAWDDVRKVTVWKAATMQELSSYVNK